MSVVDCFVSKDFQKGSTVEVNPQFTYGMVIFVSVIGICVCLFQIFVNLGKYARLMLACVPIQITMAMFQIICFVLWALVAELYVIMAAGLAFCLIAILGHFGCALGATNLLLLPQYVKSSQANVEDRKQL